MVGKIENGQHGHQPNEVRIWLVYKDLEAFSKYGLQKHVVEVIDVFFATEE